jgi:hypothetical protein
LRGDCGSEESILKASNLFGRFRRDTLGFGHTSFVEAATEFRFSVSENRLKRVGLRWFGGRRHGLSGFDQPNCARLLPL